MDSFYIILYFISSLFFIIGIKMLSSPLTARSGNFISFSGMVLAIVTTLTFVKYDLNSIIYIASGIILGGIIGLTFAKKVQMTSMPQMVAIFNGLGGLASALIAFSEIIKVSNKLEFNLISISILISVLIGSVTFSGSVTGFLKLQSIITGKPLLIPLRNYLNLLLLMLIVGLMITSFFYSGNTLFFYILISTCLLLGILIVLPIGGADMPVVIALLNSYSGIVAAFTGFIFSNIALIISGSLIGASGLILTRIMTKAMNRSLANVILGGFGATSENISADTSDKNYKSGSSDDIASILEFSENIIIVPGYGLAVAQAQHSLKELLDVLTNQEKNVIFAIHPVAGRMPGHMNVLLAEANIDYELLLDLDQVNEKFSQTDISIVIGANDVVNPAAKLDKNSPIYGMPILEIEKSKSIVVLKRSMNPGFAGLDNDIFYNEKTVMLFGDAKDSIDSVTRSIKELS
ncbi:MAG: NAD(P)(+) transhydrogenase (Re/Si-specific) subunit beta [Dehalococcoidia bacterium]